MDAALRICSGPPTGDIVRDRVRGVRWVCEWAMAISAISLASLVLLDFGSRIATERKLVDAASAGLREAALPRATARSVEAMIRKQLGLATPPARYVQISLARNGAPVSGAVRAQANDQLAVILTIRSELVTPAWLARLSFLSGEATVYFHGRASARL